MALNTCERCGKVVGKSSLICPHCSARLASTKCKNCSFSGAEGDFIGGVCPRCGTALGKPRSGKRCSNCGRQFTSSNWVCPYCGHFVWQRIGLMAGVSVLCLGAALYMLPFPSLIAWLVIAVGAGSLFTAANGLGTALEIRKAYLFIIALLIFTWLVLNGIVMHKKGSYLHVFPETATLIPTMTITPTPTITLGPSQTPPPSPTTMITPTPSGNATITGVQVNVRQDPSTASNIVAVVNLKDQLPVFGRSPDGGWLLVQTSSGTSGWVSVNLVTLDKPLITLKVVTPASH